MLVPAGKEVRFSRLFNQEYQKSIMVALDHGGGGVYEGLENIESTLREVVTARPDAILLNISMIRRFTSLFQGKEVPAFIASLDINLAADRVPDLLAQDAQGIEIGSVEEAVRLGVDGVKLIITWGRITESLQNRLLEWVGRVAEECSYWNLPLIIEPCLWGKRIPKHLQSDPKLIADICRIAAEVGGDMLKVDYTGDKESFRKVVKSSMVPILVLGGPKFASAQKFMSFVDDAMSAGAAGVVVGRSIYQSRNIAKMIEALREVIYKGNVEKGLQMAQGVY